MATPQKRRGLGTGLAALMGDAEESAPVEGGRLSTIPIELLSPSPLQPRRTFNEAEIDALAQSVREKGILQPLIVRPRPEGGFEIVAGERRWRAAQRAALHELPVIVRKLGDAEVLELALIENLQRQDLGPIEEAMAFRRLIDDHGRDQAEIAEAIGKSRSHVANTLRLLALPDEVLRMIEEGKLTAGHARALLGTADPAGFAREVMSGGLNVRQTEALAQRSLKPRKVRSGASGSPDMIEAQELLARSLGLAVAIRARGRGGVLTIRYRDLDQLDGLMTKLTFSG